MTSHIPGFRPDFSVRGSAVMEEYIERPHKDARHLVPASIDELAALHDPQLTREELLAAYLAKIAAAGYEGIK